MSNSFKIASLNMSDANETTPPVRKVSLNRLMAPKRKMID